MGNGRRMFLWRRHQSILKRYQQSKFLHLYCYFTLSLKGCRIMSAKRHQCFGLRVTFPRTQICTQPTLLEETHIFHLPLRFSLQITVLSSLILRKIWWDCNQASVNFNMPGRGRQGENLTWQIHLLNSQWRFFTPRKKVGSSFYSSWAYYF